MHRKRTAVVAIVATAIVAQLAGPAAGAAGPQAQQKARRVAPRVDRAKVAAQLDKLVPQAGRGTVPVVVTLAVPYGAEPKLKKADVAAQRADIRSARERVLAIVRAAGGSPRRSFESVPAVSFEATPGALHALRALGTTVANVKKVGSMKAFRGTTVNRIGGNVVRNQIGVNGQGQAVAVIDTGVDSTHPELAGRVVYEACFSDHSWPDPNAGDCPNGKDVNVGPGAARPCPSMPKCEHGTHVAGIVAGNGAAPGVAPGASIVAVQVFDEDGEDADDDDVVAALEHVYERRGQWKLAAVNLSLGRNDGDDRWSGTCDDEDDSMTAVLGNLRAAGVAPVVSAGNDADRHGMSWPSCVSSAISVANLAPVSPSGWRVADSSNISAQTTIGAPGTGIYRGCVDGAGTAVDCGVTSTIPGGGTAGKSGTSMAAPHVAGTMALLRHHNPDLGVNDAITYLRSGPLLTDTRPGGTDRVWALSARNALTQVQARLNNFFADAKPFPAEGGSFTGHNGRTWDAVRGHSAWYGREPGEPRHAGNAGGRSAWFRWDVPDAGTIHVDTFRSEIDTLLGVHTGNSVVSLTQLAASDDAAGTKNGQVAVRVNGPTRVWIAVDGKRAAGAQDAAVGAITISAKLHRTAPLNNHIGSARAITGRYGQVIEDRNVEASAESGEQPHAGSAASRSVWYRWTAVENGPTTFTTAGSGFDTRLHVYRRQSGDPVTVANVASVAGNDDDGAPQSSVGFTASAGTEYYVAVDGFRGAQGIVNLQWTQNPAANDRFERPVALVGDVGTSPWLAIDRATGQPRDPVRFDVYGRPDRNLWFTWTPATSGPAKVSAVSIGSTRIEYQHYAVYTGNSLANLRTADEHNVVAGTTYRIVVMDRSNVPPRRVRLQVVVGAPANDSWYEPTPVSGETGELTDRSDRAIADYGEAREGGRLPTASLWYSWTAPASGLMSVSTHGSSFDTTLGVYTGEDRFAPTLVAENDDIQTWMGATLVDFSRGSHVSFNATQGTPYRFRVDGHNGARGTVLMKWRFGTPRLTVDDVAVREDAGRALVPIRLDGPASSRVDVRVTTSDASAASGADYQAVSTVSRIYRGKTEAVVRVPIVNDAWAEGDETFNVTVTYGGTAVSLADPVAVVTITDDDAGSRLDASPSTIVRGQTVRATWRDIATPTQWDWVGLYPKGVGERYFVAWVYTGGAASGSVDLTVPEWVMPGSYELRLLADDGYVRLASSSLLTLNPVASVYSDTEVSRGTTMTAAWQHVDAPTARDWIGVFAKDAADTAPLVRAYTNGTSAGTVSLAVPAEAAPGDYETRLFRDDGTVRVAVGRPLTIFGTARIQVLEEGVSRGGQVTVSWTGIESPTSTDWIGLYYPGSPWDSWVTGWVYTNGQASGTTTLTIPTWLEPGDYHVRLYAQNGSRQLAPSSGVTVIP